LGLCRTQDINILDDQPTAKAEFFNFDSYAQSITKIITNEKTGTPLVIGIFGDWGSGKTSLMCNIQTKLDGERSTTIWFNAWKYNAEDAIWRVLLTTILEKLKEKYKCLFIWEKIQGNDNGKLIDFLTKNYGVNWIKEYQINKIDDGKTIRITAENKILSLSLNNEKTEVNLEIKDDRTRTDKFYVKKQNGELNIYKYKILKKKSAHDIENEIKDLNDIQDSLYFEVQREELGYLKFYPGKAIKLFIKSILSEIPILKGFIDVKKSGFDELFELFQRDKKLIKIKKVQFVEEFHDQFEKLIENFFNNKRVVIFIDDLDRCSPEKAIEVLEAIKLFLDVKGCIFVLGIDRRVISRGIELKYKELNENNTDKFISGNNYLEKIIQLDFFLPKISEDYYELILKGIEGNPRKIKRILNFIQFQLNLSKTIPEIQDKIKKLKKNYGARGERIFEALLIEWTIISSYYPNFMRDVVEEDGSLLLNMHNYYAGKYEQIESNKKLKSYKDNEKYGKLVDMIEVFSDTFMSPIMYEEDIKDPKSLIKKLVTQNGLSGFIFKQFSSEEENHLTDFCIKVKVPSAETCKLLVDGLNKIIKGDYIYKDDLFTNIILSDKTKKLIESKTFLFNWDEIPGNDNERLKSFLKQKFNVDWIKTAKIEKIDNEKTIRVSNEKNSLLLKLNTEKTKLNIEIDGNRTEFIAKTENYKLNIYRKMKTKEIYLANRLLLDDAYPDEIDNFKDFNLNSKIIQDIIQLSGTVDSEESKKKDREKEKSIKTIGKEEVLQIIKDTKKDSLKGKSMTGIDISDKDLSGFDLTTVKLNGAIMINTKLEHANLEGANLYQANLEGAFLDKAILRNAKLTRANLRYAHLNNAILENAQLNNAELRSAELNGAHLNNANLKDANLFNANMESADLSGANLYNAGMKNARMEGANFGGADLRSCDLVSANFDEKTEFRGAEIDSVTIDNLGGTNWEKAQWDEEVLEKIKDKYSRS
jgi:uncharacterized protein YjbI with pentapeptide repeats